MEEAEEAEGEDEEEEKEKISIVTSLSDCRIFNERLLAISGNAVSAPSM